MCVFTASILTLKMEAETVYFMCGYQRFRITYYLQLVLKMEAGTVVSSDVTGVSKKPTASNFSLKMETETVYFVCGYQRFGGTFRLNFHAENMVRHCVISLAFTGISLLPTVSSFILKTDIICSPKQW
jgi:hypothetical protein